MKTPVRDILGDWFYYHEGFRSSKMTTADILSHRAGLPYNDPIRIYGYTIREFVEYVCRPIKLYCPGKIIST